MNGHSQSHTRKRQFTPLRALLSLVIIGALLGTTVEPVAAETGPINVVDNTYSAKYLVQPNPLAPANGLALDGNGHLYAAQALYNRVTKINLATGATQRIADDTDPLLQALQTPDDVTFGPDGKLYTTNALGKTVVRMAPDGTGRTTIATITDGTTGPNGIAFSPDGRLFVSDLAFDPSHAGGLWLVDPNGIVPPVLITHQLRVPEGFGFASNGLAYVPEFYAGQIAVVNPNNPLNITRLPVQFDGTLVSLKVMPKNLDPAEPLIALENRANVSNLWRVDRTSGNRTLIASGSSAFDNLAINSNDGTIYVSNYIRGGIQRLAPGSQKLVQAFPNGPLATPTSLSLRPDGSLLVADVTSVSSVSPEGKVSALSQFLLNQNQGLTPGAVQIGNALYFTDLLDSSRTGRLMKLDLSSGALTEVTSGYLVPWHVRQGPPGSVLLSDESLGIVYRVNIADGTQTVVAAGLNSPAGLAYDASKQIVYISEAGAGRVVAVPVGGGVPTPVATGLQKPEGVTIDAQGRLLVVDADGAAQQNAANPGSLLRIDLGNGQTSTVATGLPTKITGITLLPGFTYSSDVLARTDGTIVVSGAANGSVIELAPK